ncbi:MAG: DUF2059 domain-containing protein [Lewinella sp.]
MKQLILFFICAVLTGTVAGQSDSLEAKVLHLIEVSGSEDMFVSSALNMINMQKESPAFEGIPDSWWTKFTERIQQNGFQDIEAELASIYLANYTEEEIDFLIEYHQNPLAQSIMAKMPLVQQQSMQVGQAWGQKIAQELEDQLEVDPKGN